MNDLDLMNTPIGFIDGRPIYSLFGGDGSYGSSTTGDSLVQVLNDGTNLNDIWAEVQAAFTEWNTERSAITSLLAFNTFVPGDAVQQSSGENSFAEASEFGEPVGVRAPANALVLGSTFKDYDLATRFTWKFLRDSTAEQVQAVASYVFEADNKLVNGSILQRLFDPTETLNEWSHRVFGLWSDDGITPPSYLGNSFTSSHNHYMVSGASVVDSGDIEDAIKTVTEHGYGTTVGSQLILLCHPNEGELIATFRAGVESRTSGPKAKFDYVPSTASPPHFMAETLVGTPPASDFNGLKVQGQYGEALVIWSYYVPPGYIAVFATSGPGHPKNPVSLREHQNTAYRGLRLIPGRDQRYPLIESFATRSFGTGIRNRGAAAIVQVKASGEYDIPVIPV